MSPSFKIGFVASQLGITTSTLRKWEQRYGFPTATRTSTGIRLYSLDQFELLKTAVRLIDSGKKPSAIFAANGLELKQVHFHKQVPAQLPPNANKTLVYRLLKHIKNNNLSAFEEELLNLVHSQDRMELVETILAPLIIQVGDAWYRGEIEVFQEHAFSEILHSTLINNADFTRERQFPRIILATPPDEKHTLGLALLYSAFTAAGADCINLGAETPADQLVSAASSFNAGVLCISLSSYSSPGKNMFYLRHLRSALPVETLIWIGGEGAKKLPLCPQGVEYYPDLYTVCCALKAHQACVLNSKR